MEKLTAIDASFLYSETEHCNSNVASVDVLQLPADVTADLFIATLKDYMSARLHLSPYLTRKLAFVPGNLDHPVWVRDTHMNLDNHIISVPVPAPGDRAAMENVVAELHAAKMPMDRPLWAMYVLTNLEGNKIAYYNQVHHSTIDGASGNATYDLLMDESPVPGPVTPAAETTEAAPRQLALSLVEDAVANFWRFQLGTVSRAMGAMDTGRKLALRATKRGGFGALGKTAPATPFNTQISSLRSWASGEFALADLKAMRKATGCTINDLVLAICAGGLRRYLERSGELPGENLIAGCPVSLRTPGDNRPGTQVTMMNVDLATGERNALIRLQKIHESAAIAKDVVQDLAGVYESNAALPGLPALMSGGIRLAESMGLARFARGPINVVISNVPGPQTARYSNGARLLAHYPVSIPTHGLGLNITVQTYEDTMFLGITACRKALPDAGRLRDDLLVACRELKNLILGSNVSQLEARQPGSAVESVDKTAGSEVPSREMVA